MPFTTLQGKDFFGRRQELTELHGGGLEANRLPLGLIGKVVHLLAVRRQLADIFRHRARKIDEWARGEVRKRGTVITECRLDLRVSSPSSFKKL